MSKEIRKNIFIGLNRFGQNVVLSLLNKLTLTFRSIGKLENNRLSEYFPSRFLTLVTSEDYNVFTKDGKKYGKEFLYENGSPAFWDTLNSISSDEVFEKIINNIIKLNNLSSEEVTNNFETKISASILSPRLFIILDIRELDDNFEDFCKKLAELNDDRVRERYSTSCLLFCPRTTEYKSNVERIHNFFEDVFLIGNDSPSLIFESDKDVKELAVNFLFALSLSDIDFKRKNSADQKFYAIGSSSIYFPYNEIVTDSLFKKLGYDDPATNKKFEGCFCGGFQEIKAGDLEDPFSLKEFEDESILKSDEVTDEYFPVPIEIENNKSFELRTDFFSWIEEHLSRMKSEFKIEARFARLNQLTKTSTFFKIAVELWKNNVEAIDFILDYEVIGRAKQKAELILSDFRSRYNDYLEKFEELIYNPSNYINDYTINRGILAWITSRDIIREIIDNRISNIPDQNENISVDSQRFLDELNHKIKVIPRPISLFSRLLLIITLSFFIAIPLNDFIFSNSSLYPAILIALTLIIISSLFIYWFSFRKQIKELYLMLHRFLTARKEEYQNKLNKIENDLIKDFLVMAARKVKSKFATRQGYFYKLLNYEFDFSKSDILSNNSLDISNPSSTENFFFRRFLVFRYLSQNIDSLKKLQERNTDSIVNEGIIKKYDPEFLEIVDACNTSIPIEKMILDVDKSHQNIGMNFISTSNLNEIFPEIYIDTLIEIGSLEFYNFIISKEEYKNLVAFINNSGKKVDQDLYSHLYNNAKLTFLWNDNESSEGNDIFFAEEIELFNRELVDKIENKFFKIIDKNNIILISVSGPKLLSDIEWN